MSNFLEIRILQGLEWISRQPVGIINMSIGGSYSEIVNKVVRSLISRGWKVVVAAGNAHQDACKYSPASEKSVITVGAISKNGDLASFSNYGKCIDVTAPGDTILSTWPGGLAGYMSGTSMATPIVAGMLSLYPEWADGMVSARDRLITTPDTVNKEIFVVSYLF